MMPINLENDYAGALPTLRDWLELLKRLTRTNTESFAVGAIGGDTWFVEANRCELRDEQLVFLTGRAIVAVANAGTWLRVLRGVTLEDFREGS